MKIGLLLSALILCLVIVFFYRSWTRGPGEAPGSGDPEARARFMSACTMTASAMQRPEAYCDCLWSKGVTSPTQTLATPAGQAAASQCASSGKRPAAPGR